MNTKLIDVVNLNGEASCLSSQRWLEILQGGEQSYLYQYFQLYVTHQKKVVIGIPGATVIDIVQFNPEVIELINQYPDIFEIIVRPFIHDIALLRSEQGFELNLQIGIAILKEHFKHITPVYLPPEFMLKSEQVNILLRNGIEYTFISNSRFSEESQQRIPKTPYIIRGTLGQSMKVIPFEKDVTKSYLKALHYYSSTSWNRFIDSSEKEFIFSWRDGESPFFINDGLRREGIWLSQEKSTTKRVFVKDTIDKLTPIDIKPTDNIFYKYYPPHSFNPWMKELRMLGFLQRTYDLEKDINKMSLIELVVFFQTLNSDILSAVEKKSPIIHLQLSPEDAREQVFTIWRTDRNFEGEDFLSILNSLNAPTTLNYLHNASLPHILKLRQRIDYFKNKSHLLDNYVSNPIFQINN